MEKEDSRQVAPYYESDRALSEYLLFHYGAPEQILPYNFGPIEAVGFPLRCVAGCLDVTALPPSARALDLGCAVGRSSFELARYCKEVIGIDYSRSFIDVANVLKRDGSLEFSYIDEGELAIAARAIVPTEIDRNLVSFEQGDAHQLRGDLGSFDVVLAANLIDRLRDPQRFLDQLPSLLRPGGQLILTSPYTWLSEYTPRENWLGGFLSDSRPVKTFEALRQSLSPSFDLLNRKDIPFLIREHARKFQWSIAEATVWRRRSTR